MRESDVDPVTIVLRLLNLQQWLEKNQNVYLNILYCSQYKIIDEYVWTILTEFIRNY